MRNLFIEYAVLTALTVGVVFATVPSENSRSGGSQPGSPSVTGHLERIAQALDLTDSQKQQAQIVFQHARQSAQPIRQELKQNREKLTAAAKAGESDEEIQKLASEQGRLLGQLVAIRTGASAKFYQILTPEQRIKADQMHEQFRQRSRAHNNGR